MPLNMLVITSSSVLDGAFLALSIKNMIDGTWKFSSTWTRTVNCIVLLLMNATFESIAVYKSTPSFSGKVSEALIIMIFYFYAHCELENHQPWHKDGIVFFFAGLLYLKIRISIFTERSESRPWGVRQQHHIHSVDIVHNLLLYTLDMLQCSTVRHY